MRTFFIGAGVALLLTGGAAYLYDLTSVTSAERSSPAGSVRLDDNASESAKGTGYGVTHKQTEDTERQTETAGR